MEDGNPDPYQPPASVSEATAEEHLTPEEINYPGGMWTIFWIGLAGGLLVGIIFIAFLAFLDTVALFGMLLPLACWCGSFGVVGWLLPGLKSRRVVRMFIGILVAFPALILYVPVCGLTMGAVAQGSFPIEGGMVIGSIVAFTSILLLFALLVRRTVRNAHPTFGAGATLPDSSAPVEGEVPGPTDNQARRSIDE